ncbi:hypothetical protein VTN02DRAFT_2261 [Thermoascus thermophilus]
MSETERESASTAPPEGVQTQARACQPAEPQQAASEPDARGGDEVWQERLVKIIRTAISTGLTPCQSNNEPDVATRQPPVTVQYKARLRYPVPPRYGGKDLVEYRKWVYACRKYFEGNYITDDAQRVSYASSWLKGGPARRWSMLKAQGRAKEFSWEQFKNWLLELLHEGSRFPDLDNVMRMSTLICHDDEHPSGIMGIFDALEEQIPLDTPEQVERFWTYFFLTKMPSAVLRRLHDLPELPSSRSEAYALVSRMYDTWGPPPRKYEHLEATVRSPLHLLLKIRKRYLNSPFAPSKRQRPAASRPPAGRKQQKRQRPDQKTRARLTREKHCYRCHEPGHVAKYCPLRTP